VARDGQWPGCGCADADREGACGPHGAAIAVNCLLDHEAAPGVTGPALDDSGEDDGDDIDANHPGVAGRSGGDTEQDRAVLAGLLLLFIFQAVPFQCSIIALRVPSRRPGAPLKAQALRADVAATLKSPSPFGPGAR